MSRLNEKSTVRDWLTDPRGKAALAPIYHQIVDGGGRLKHRRNEQSGRQQEVDQSNRQIEMLDMTLLHVLLFHEENLTVPAEDMVALLLAQCESYLVGDGSLD